MSNFTHKQVAIKAGHAAATAALIAAIGFGAAAMAKGNDTNQGAAERLTSSSLSAAAMLDAPARHVEQRMQDTLADCMAKAGFRYTPTISDAVFAGGAQQQGSVVNGIFSKVQTASRNANQVHFDGLDESRQAAYAQQLWNRESGCATQAYEATYGATLTKVGADRAAAFEDALNNVSAQLEAHPGFDKAMNRWAACASNATGVALSNPTDISRIVLENLDRAFMDAEGLPLTELINAPDAAVDDGVYSAAVDSARQMERTLQDATSGCDQTLNATLEGIQLSIVRRTFGDFGDVISATMDAR